MPTVWRIVKRTHAATAFDGKGAQRFGGRWNSPGRRAVYVSATKSLATLEMLVHLDVAQPLPRFVAFAFHVDQGSIEQLSPRRLPRNWWKLRALFVARGLGDEWLAACRALALAVPSAIVPEESNYLLNPVHPAFAKLKFGRPMPVMLDPRFFS